MDASACVTYGLQTSTSTSVSAGGRQGSQECGWASFLTHYILIQCVCACVCVCVCISAATGAPYSYLQLAGGSTSAALAAAVVAHGTAAERHEGWAITGHVSLGGEVLRVGRVRS